MDDLQNDVAIVELLFALRQHLHGFFVIEPGASIPVRCMCCGVAYQTINFVHVGHYDGCSVGEMFKRMEAVRVGNRQ